MSELVIHGACGKSWRQRGNRTGHCPKCHETFEGLSLFDWHQVVGRVARFCAVIRQMLWGARRVYALSVGLGAARRCRRGYFDDRP